MRWLGKKPPTSWESTVAKYLGGPLSSPTTLTGGCVTLCFKVDCDGPCLQLKLSIWRIAVVFPPLFTEPIR